MDLKGITWVGHVYQKLEAMCLEVEEIMYQDTVKFVENHVDTVGASVKRFCSDVMQDLLPPSSMDPVKGAIPSNLQAEQKTEVGIYKKPKVVMKEEAMKVNNELLTKDSLATSDWDEHTGHGSFYGFHVEDTSFQPSSALAVKGASSDMHLKEYDKRRGHNQSSVSVQKISNEENFPPSETSGAITQMKKDTCKTLMKNDMSETLSSCELLDRKQVASGDHVSINPTPVTIEVAGHKSCEEIHHELENASKGAPVDLNNHPSSQNSIEIENLSARSSSSSLSAELNDVCTNNGVVTLVGSSVNANVKLTKFPDKINFVSRSGRTDYSTMDTIESSIIVEQGFETIQQTNSIQVEDTCVLVTEDELRFVPHKAGKHRPYKKKIQDAISSRMRSSRKQEYEQLAVWYGNDVKSKHADSKSSPSLSSCEFDWELI